MAKSASEKPAPPETVEETKPEVESTPKIKVSPVKIEPRKPKKPLPQDIRLSARQYVRARGYRWERCAGFLHEMKRKHPGEKTRPEWAELWDSFWKRPVK